MEMEESKKSSLIYFIIIIFLLAGISFLAYKWSAEQTANEDCNNTNSIIQSELDDLENILSDYVGDMSNDMRVELQNMLVTYDNLIEKDASKADSLNVQKKEIEGLMQKLQQTRNISARELNKLKKENETLKGIMRGYVKQIDSLYTMTKQLSVDLNEKSNELNLTKEERDIYKKDAEDKDAKVKLGSKLRAYNIKSGALRLKSNNVTEETPKAKKAYQFYSSFTLQENLIASKGKRTIYLQVSDPNGNVFMSRGSNTVNTTDGILKFSDQKSIEYNNQALDVAIYYDLKGENAPKGKYIVKLICDGAIIGNDSFVLK